MSTDSSFEFDSNTSLIASFAVGIITVIVVSRILGRERVEDATNNGQGIDSSNYELDGYTYRYPGLAEWSSDDGKHCLQLVDKFRCDPFANPLAQESAVGQEEAEQAWADFDTMDSWLDTHSTHDWPEVAEEVTVSGYGEAIEIEGRVQNGILVSLVGLPNGATLSYEDITVGVPDGEQSFSVLGTTMPRDFNSQRTAYLALHLPEVSCTYAGDFTLAISDSVSCTEPSVSDCSSKTTLTIKLVWAPELTWSDQLFELATDHSYAMGLADQISHEGYNDRLDQIESLIIDPASDTTCSLSGAAEFVARVKLDTVVGNTAFEDAIEIWAQSGGPNRIKLLDDYTYGACSAVMQFEEWAFVTAKFVSC